MSQSLLISGKFRNNKRLSIGLYNPVNNAVAGPEEFEHLKNMFKQYIVPNKNRFKEVTIAVCTMAHGEVYVSSLLKAYRLILSDKPDFGIIN